MKRTAAGILIILTSFALFAQVDENFGDDGVAVDVTALDIPEAVLVAPTTSYANNEFQLLARRYLAWAAEAIDNGDYDAAIEYAALAEENAGLSDAYIRMMLRRGLATQKMAQAATRLSWAEKSGAVASHPEAASDATLALSDARAAFDGEDYEGAAAHAQTALDALAGITAEDSTKPWHPGDPGLPRYYVVYQWQSSGDCFWNIAGKHFVYGNPWEWQRLYAANRDKTELPGNPDRIAPGTILEIPSRPGEIRSGTYDARR
jgi:nucleoid-associated protein YgaU